MYIIQINKQVDKKAKLLFGIQDMKRRDFFYVKSYDKPYVSNRNRTNFILELIM